jgi:hypothetical protein
MECKEAVVDIPGREPRNLTALALEIQNSVTIDALAISD